MRLATRGFGSSPAFGGSGRKEGWNLEELLAEHNATYVAVCVFHPNLKVPESLNQQRPPSPSEPSCLSTSTPWSIH